MGQPTKDIGKNQKPPTAGKDGRRKDVEKGRRSLFIVEWPFKIKGNSAEKSIEQGGEIHWDLGPAGRMDERRRRIFASGEPRPKSFLFHKMTFKSFLHSTTYLHQLSYKEK
jgi:hypothetical protein